MVEGDEEMNLKLMTKGLAGKLIRFVIIFVLCIGLVFAALSRLQVSELQKDVRIEEEKRLDLIEGEYSRSMEELTKDSILQLSIWAADMIDDEFWVVDHDIRVLASQVEDVYRYPEKYKRNPVYEPRMENSGTFALQLLCSTDYSDIDPATMEMMERLSNLAPMMKEIISGNEGYTLDVYISTPDNVTLAMDVFSDQKFDDNGHLKEYIPTDRPWYQGAVSLGDMYVSNAVHSYFYDFEEVIFGYPVYVDDKLVAVIEASSRIGIIEKKMAERNVGKSGFSVLISKNGQLVCSQRETGELKLRDDFGEDIRESVNPQLREMIDHGLEGKSDVDVVEVDGEKYYAAHAPLESIGWTQFSFVSVEEMNGPKDTLLASMETSTKELKGDISGDFKRQSVYLLIGILLFMLIAILAASSLAKRRVKPIEQMTEAVKGFVSDDLSFEMKDTYKTGDEIEDLANAFLFMSGKMKEYVDEIVANTAEKEKIKAEFEAASQIQRKMLPEIEPFISGEKRFELYAKMIPARDVGGDLYDFYFFDDDHLVLMIGDVSGKGVTAALFMALSKQMLKSQMQLHDGNLIEAMEEANKRLCEQSSNSMFVTVWLGVLELSTGLLQFVDAGHLYAAVKRGDKDFVLEKDNHSFLVAGLDFSTYKLNTTTLQKGDVLYLYTDGVTEAHSRTDELFGDKRLLDALNKQKDSSLEEMDNAVRDQIEEFSKETEQYDDITTLSLRFIGNN